MGSFAMFPLGWVLFPHMPLALRVFEERYLGDARACWPASPRIGVVLIESGREAAGVTQPGSASGRSRESTNLVRSDDDLAVIALGGRRIEVVGG